jgi:hypothetical protein
MAEITYGQLNSWDDGNVSGGNDFMRLEVGSNKVRVFTNPYQFIVHWVKDSSGASRKIKCAVENCPLCKKGVKTQYRWFLGVIDRKTELPMILEISSQIYSGIKGYVSNPEWGDVRMYDIDVQRGVPQTNPLYTIQPSPNKRALNESEKELAKNFLERVDISKFTQPSTPEEVDEKIGGNSSGSSGGNPQYAIGTQTVTNDGGNIKPNISAKDFNFGDDDL